MTQMKQRWACPEALNRLGAAGLLMAAGLAFAQPASDREKWEPLFNGRNLDGWVAKLAHHDLGDNFGDTFRVENGLLRVSYDKYQAFNRTFGHLFHRRKLSRYRLRIEYRFYGEQPKDGEAWARMNSGVMFHAQAPETMLKEQDFPISLEAQFLAGGKTTMNVCTPGTEIYQRGIIVKPHCSNSTSKPYQGSEWVAAEIEVLGAERIRHFADGQLVLEYERPTVGGGVVNNFDPAVKKDGTLLSEGYIALQSESHPIEFRRVDLLVLK
jgi:hypothetical protein